MGFENRFLAETARVKPDRPQKNKGYQGLPVTIGVASGIPMHFYGALQTSNGPRIPHVAAVLLFGDKSRRIS
jgi:hypothetical protein